MLSPEQDYTFDQIFALGIDSDELVEYFGYTTKQCYLNLPKAEFPQPIVDDVRSRLNRVRPHVILGSERARREILIAPVVSEANASLRIEYPLKVSHQLQGNLDYLLTGKIELLIIEAKLQDNFNGMNQLLVELIALDQWERTSSAQATVIGAISIGEIWKFASLDRKAKHIKQGLELYKIPEELEQVMGILLPILL